MNTPEYIDPSQDVAFKFLKEMIEGVFTLENDLHESDEELAKRRDSHLNAITSCRFINEEQFCELTNLLQKKCDFKKPLLSILLLKEALKNIIDASIYWRGENEHQLNKRLQNIESCLGGFNQTAYQPKIININLKEDTNNLAEAFYSAFLHQSTVSNVLFPNENMSLHEMPSAAISNLIWDYACKLAQPDFIFKHILLNFDPSDDKSYHYQRLVNRLVELHQQNIIIQDGEDSKTILDFLNTDRGIDASLQKLIVEENINYLPRIRHLAYAIQQQLSLCASAAAMKSQLFSQARTLSCDVSVDTYESHATQRKR